MTASLRAFKLRIASRASFMSPFDLPVVAFMSSSETIQLARTVASFPYSPKKFFGSAMKLSASSPLRRMQDVDLVAPFSPSSIRTNTCFAMWAILLVGREIATGGS